ncbi:type II secretion system protein N [Luteibacter sp. PPL201]|uniref:Type II secretion system protein N n=1 Tax=Luteibacter sahnii TaxID=3021977 RepID=A0ABT6BA03_9GAMM
MRWLLKWFRRIVIAIALLALGAGLFYLFLPARVVAALIEQRAHGLTLDGVSGTAWDGHAARVVSAGGRDLGVLEWRLGRDAILGRIHLDIHLQGAAGRVDAHVERTQPGLTRLSGVAFRLDAGALAGPALPRELVPQGTIEGTVPRADLQDNWPMTLDADARWRDAAVRTPEGVVALGGMAFKANSRAGVLRAALKDDGDGSLRVDLGVAGSPLGWRMDGVLAPRIADTALTHLIARFGPVGRDGTVVFHRKAGLAPADTP